MLGGVQFGDGREGGAAFGFEVVVGLPQALAERVVGCAVLGLTHDVVLPAGEIGESALEPLSFGLSLPSLAVIGTREIGREQLSAVRAEHSGDVDVRDGVENLVLSDVGGLLVPRVLVGASAVVGGGVAHVVGGVVAVVAVHPPSAVVEDHAAQHVRTTGLGVGVGGVAVAGAAFGFAAGGEFVVHPLRDQRLVHRLCRPDPERRIVDLASARAGGTLVEHLVAGVLGVDQDLVHAGLAPRTPRPRPAGRFGWRVLGRFGVEPVGDRVVAQVLVVAPQRDLSDRLPTHPVRLQPSLGLALGGLHRVGMPEGLGPVPVRWFADVPAVTHVGAQAAPGLFSGVVGLVFGHRLVDPP
nr:hypothetical protein [Actinophytocola oryzae]